jgi:hypothetical protein
MAPLIVPGADFTTTAFEAAAFGGAPTFGAVFGGADATFDEGAPPPFGFVAALLAITFFFPAIFTRFSADPTPISTFFPGSFLAGFATRLWMGTLGDASFPENSV